MPGSPYYSLDIIENKDKTSNTEQQFVKILAIKMSTYTRQIKKRALKKERKKERKRRGEERKKEGKWEGWKSEIEKKEAEEKRKK